MVDAAESGAVLGVPDAAEIPTPLRGRAFLRLGPKQIIPFQAAFTGAAAVKSNTAPVVVRALADEDTITGVVEKPVGPTQGETIVREIEELWRSLGWDPPRRPWMPELPSLVTHEELRAVDDSVLGSDEFSLGLVDDPERQSQPLAIWDVRLASGMRVFGGSGSGKTSTLRLIGQLASDISRANDWDLVVIDLGTRGLADLQRCPNLVASGNADDIESLTRAIRYVSAEVQRRRALIAAKGCDSYMDLRDGDEKPRRLMVLIDDYQNLEELVSVGDYARSAAEIEIALLSTAMIDARPTGVHFVVSARRRNDLRSNLHAALGGRVVLRSDDEMELLDHGLPAAKSAGPLPPGRAFWLDDRRVQISMMDSRQSSTDNRDKLSAFGRILSQTKSGASRRPSSAALPSVFGMNCQASGLKVTVGIRDVSMESQEVDLAKAPLVIVGPRESGKSSTLQWVASQFVETKLRWIKESADLAEVSEGAVLLIDDSERFDDYALDDQLRLLRFERNCPVVLALNPRNTISSLARDVVRDATFLVLQPDDRHSSNFIQSYFDRSPYLRPGLQFPAGRGVLSIGRGASVIHVPLVGH